MKILILAFIFTILILPANAVCMLDEQCASSEKSSNIENGIIIDSNQIPQQKMNFMPEFDISNQPSPNINSEYNPQQNLFHQTPAPRDCVFGLCLP